MESRKKRWSQAIADFLHPRVLSMLFLGLSAGVPILLIFSSLSLWLREAGLERSAVTFFSWAALGYSFKFVWAPLIDRLPVPVLTQWLGRRRAWILLSQIFIIIAIFWMGATDPQQGSSALTMMALAAVLLGFSSATQDIVIDAYRIEAANEDSQAAMASTYIAGYRIGMLVAGAGALFLASHWGTTKEQYVYEAWQQAYTAMAAVMLIGVLTTFSIPEPTRFRQMASELPTGYIAALLSLLFVGNEVMYAISESDSSTYATFVWMVRIILVACALLLFFSKAPARKTLSNGRGLSEQSSQLCYDTANDLPGLVLLPLSLIVLIIANISTSFEASSDWLIAWFILLALSILAVVYYIRLLITKDIKDRPEEEQVNQDIPLSDLIQTLLLFAAIVAGVILTYKFTSSLSSDLKSGLTNLLNNKPLASLLIETPRLLLALLSPLVVARLLIKLGLIKASVLEDTYLRPIKDFFLRYGKQLALLLLLLVGLYRISDIVLGVISTVFYQDMGFTKTEIASVVKSYGLFMTIAGGFLGGLLSTRFGVMRILFLGAFLSAITNLLFMLLASKGHDMTWLYVVISADNLSAGLASAAFVAFLSSLTNIQFTAVQYAIFSSLMTLLPKTIGGYSGSMVDNIGYPNFFMITALMGIPVLFLIVYASKRLNIKEPIMKKG